MTTAPAPEVTQKTESNAAPTGEAERPTVDEMVHHPAKGGFWQSSFAISALPFLMSLAIHIGIGLAVWATYQGVKKVYEVVKEQIIIPDATIVENAPTGGIPNPGLGDDPTRSAAQDQVQDVSADNSSWANKTSQSLSTSLMGGGSGDAANDVLIGLGQSGMGQGKGAGAGAGSGKGSGNGDGGGPLAQYGVPGGGGGLGPKSPFMGISGNALRIIYLCDASGTMIDSFDFLRSELKAAVDVLKPIQSFNVMFFKDDGFSSLDKTLVPANPQFKRKTYNFVEESTAGGGTNPMPAIQAAFAMQPQLLYMLTDGFDQIASYDELIDSIAKLNVAKKVKINVILLQRGRHDEKPDPAAQQLEDVCRKIAQDNGGILKIVPVR